MVEGCWARSVLNLLSHISSNLLGNQHSWGHHLQLCQGLHQPQHLQPELTTQHVQLVPAPLQTIHGPAGCWSAPAPPQLHWRVIRAAL